MDRILLRDDIVDQQIKNVWVTPMKAFPTDGWKVSFPFFYTNFGYVELKTGVIFQIFNHEMDLTLPPIPIMECRDKMFAIEGIYEWEEAGLCRNKRIVDVQVSDMINSFSLFLEDRKILCNTDNWGNTYATMLVDISSKEQYDSYEFTDFWKQTPATYPY